MLLLRCHKCNLPVSQSYKLRSDSQIYKLQLLSRFYKLQLVLQCYQLRLTCRCTSDTCVFSVLQVTQIITTPRWDTADAEIKVVSTENLQLLKLFLLGWSWSETSFACFTHCQAFRSSNSSLWILRQLGIICLPSSMNKLHD